MTLNDYQTLAQRTSNSVLPSNKIENGVLGLCGESGECADLYKKNIFQGLEVDREAMKAKLGDVLWHCAELAAGLGVTLEDVAAGNIAKLQKRYPKGFDVRRSMEREG